MKLGFTLIELIIVVVILGIVATFALPAFRVTKEKALDREAIANLRLIQAAQRIYNMEGGFFYDTGWGGPLSDEEAINQNLRLSLPVVARNWNYEAHPDGSGGFCAKATRITDNRVFIIDNVRETPDPSGACGG